MSKSLPRLSFNKVRGLLLTVLVGSILFASGYLLGNKNYKLPIVRGVPTNRQVDFSLFWKTWDTLEANYFDKSKLDPTKMIYGAIQGMVASVGDPYTVFLTPAENKVVQEDLSGNFQGVGIQIGFKGKQLTVIAPLPGSPAEKAEIKAGDYIIGIKDDKKGIDMGTTGLSLPDAVQAIRGNAGTKVTLALMRDGSADPVLVTVTREDILVPSVTVDYVGEAKDVAQLKILKFGGDTEKEWNTAVAAILKKQPRAIILDLRNNPGGYLQGAVDIAGDFLSNNSLVTYDENATSKKEEFKTNRLPRLAKFPVVILVNGGSASASEILAGALRDDIKTKLIGTKTFGKGTIQEPLQLNGGAGLHITTAKWLTPKGIWVNDKGLDPDISIEDDAKTPADEQLLKALDTLK